MKVVWVGCVAHLCGRHGHHHPEMYKKGMQVGQKAQVATLGL